MNFRSTRTPEAHLWTPCTRWMLPTSKKLHRLHCTENCNYSNVYIEGVFGVSFITVSLNVFIFSLNVFPLIFLLQSRSPNTPRRSCHLFFLQCSRPAFPFSVFFEVSFSLFFIPFFFSKFVFPLLADDCWFFSVFHGRISPFSSCPPPLSPSPPPCYPFACPLLLNGCWLPTLERFFST